MNSSPEDLNQHHQPFPYSDVFLHRCTSLNLSYAITVWVYLDLNTNISLLVDICSGCINLQLPILKEFLQLLLGSKVRSLTSGL